MRTTRVFSQQPTTIAVFSLLIGVNFSLAEVFGQSEKPAKLGITTSSNERDGTLSGSPPRAELFHLNRIRSSDYANFPVNWAEGHVYRLGLLRSAREYDQVFQPAAAAGDRRPSAPDPKIYEKEMIVTISRVIKAPANPAKLNDAIQINGIYLREGDVERALYVYFTCTDGPESASHTVKATASVRILKREVPKVIFVEFSEGKSLDAKHRWLGQENTAVVGELNIDEGQWLLPEAQSPKPSQP